MINFYDHIEGDKLKLQNPNGDDFILVDKEQALADIKSLLKKNAEFKIQSDKQTLKKIEEDLNKSETILSPYYWLQQNDVVYVTPNKAKARNSDIGNSTSLWFSATSILVSLASLLFNILK